ncbi:MAG: nuclease-related domain-containing protein [Pseudoxanthomonas suwonensis]|nr:nuclease-related domain-containing protein [Pseudoxanthomonas suwonensis]
MKWQQFTGHAAFFLSMLIVVAVVLGYRLASRTKQRRSPLAGKQLGHVPGQQLQQRIDKHTDDMDHGLQVMMLALPLLFMVWVTGKMDWATVRVGAGEVLYVVGWVLFFGFGFLLFRRSHRLREQAKDGLLAERVTGMQLNRLMARGCIVMHDLPADGFNIDHVVISPRGIYAVETKSFRKPRSSGKQSATVEFDGAALRFPDFMDRSAVEQATRQAKWLASELRQSLGSDYPVIAALALPGWYVQQDSSVWYSDGVKVFSPMGNGCNFMFKDSVENIDATRRMLASKALALRYPKLDA